VFWPSDYKGEYLLPDYLPHIAHNSEDKIFLAFRYSDTAVSYDLLTDELAYHSLGITTEFPQKGLKEADLADERKFAVVQPQIVNYMFYEGRHIIAFKPQSEFVTNNRINSYYTINWNLLIFSRDFKLLNTYCLNPKEDAEWYQMGVFKDQVLLPGNSIRRDDGKESRSFKSFTLN